MVAGQMNFGSMGQMPGFGTGFGFDAMGGGFPGMGLNGQPDAAQLQQMQMMMMQGGMGNGFGGFPMMGMFAFLPYLCNLTDFLVNSTRHDGSDDDAKHDDAEYEWWWLWHGSKWHEWHEYGHGWYRSRLRWRDEQRIQWLE